MSRFKNPLGRGKRGTGDALQAVRSKFAAFLSLLELHDQIMGIISDMEEKSQGEYLFDLNYIRTSIVDVRRGVIRLIEIMIELGGPSYHQLRDRYADIGARIDDSLPWCRKVERDRFCIALDGLGRENACSVGSKCAQLGELRTRLDLPVPDGFAITAWACRYFRTVNELDERIARQIASIDFRSLEDLQRVSQEIQDTINNSPIPDDLANAIMEDYTALAETHPESRFAIRSSALGEDTWFSFAGRYATLLNVRPEQVLSAYREVLASKFTPKAIYYFLSHSLHEDDLAMGVGCVEMIDAVASGVVYTRNPVDPEDTSILVHSIFGLGQYLVDGMVDPDYFVVERESLTTVSSRLAHKTVKLVIAPESGTVERSIPKDQQDQPSVTPDQLRRLAEYAIKIEKHYNQPQDIEWAMNADGQIYLLQSRPLKLVTTAPLSEPVDVSDAKVMRSGGITICPGAARGPVVHVSSIDDLPSIPDRAILVTYQPFPGLVTVMDRASAIIAEVGGLATHMATIAREYRIPTVGGISNVKDLPDGKIVTVDATSGTIYEGELQTLIEAREPDYDLFADMDIFRLLEDLLIHVAPLHLIQPADPDFQPASCTTLHDIIRYVHQKAIEEMFYGGVEVASGQQISHRLKTEVPITVDIIYLDRELSPGGEQRLVEEDKIGSRPMEAFWAGFHEEGWPTAVKPRYPAHIPSAMGSRGRVDGFSENSFAVLSREYMVLSLRMGYHFTTIEAFCTQDPNKNYIRYQHKQGGASLARRIRRVKVIAEILHRMGFVNRSKSDFLQANTAHLEGQELMDILGKVGRLTLLTKQLDMALSTDAIAHWYIKEYSKRLGIPIPEEAPEELGS